MTREIHLVHRRRRKRHSSIFLLMLGVAAVVLLTSLYKAGDTSKWPTAPGIVTGTRVELSRLQPLIGSGRRSNSETLLYDSEFRVAYRVNGRLYAVWSQPICSDVDTAWLHLKTENLEREAEATVRYNPQRREEAYASILENGRC